MALKNENKISDETAFILMRIYKAGIQDTCIKILNLISESPNINNIEIEINQMLNP